MDREYTMQVRTEGDPHVKNAKLRPHGGNYDIYITPGTYKNDPWVWDFVNSGEKAWENNKRTLVRVRSEEELEAVINFIRAFRG